MNLKANTVSSHQQLVARLIKQRKKKTWFLSWDHKHLLIHAFKTAIAAMACYCLARAIHFHDGYWAAISAVIVMQSNFGATMKASRDRFIGTLIGAALGFSFSVVGVLPWNFAAAILTAVILCGLLELRSSSRLAGVTICVVMLIERKGTPWYLPLHRVLEVLLGILTALLVATLVFPDRARKLLKDGLAEEFLLLSSYFEAILHGFGGAPAENLSAAQADVQRCISSNKNLLPERTLWWSGVARGSGSAFTVWAFNL